MHEVKQNDFLDSGRGPLARNFLYANPVLLITQKHGRTETKNEARLRRSGRRPKVVGCMLRTIPQQTQRFTAAQKSIGVFPYGTFFSEPGRISLLTFLLSHRRNFSPFRFADHPAGVECDDEPVFQSLTSYKGSLFGRAGVLLVALVTGASTLTFP
jgi:hypothetical protein